MRNWILAARPRTLTAAISPVVVGTALAFREGGFHPLAALAALLGAVLIQIGANFANDVYDFRKGADVNRVGPTRVTTAGLLSPRAVEIGMWVVFGLAALCGAYLIYLRGWPIVLIGLLSIAAAILYTGGPFPLGYHGLGDLFTFVFFGLVAVMGTYFAQTGAVNPASLFAALPMGALVTNILVVNNVRDADTDKAAGKRTLAVLLGRGPARLEYDLMLWVAYITPVVLMLDYDFAPWVLLPLVSLPLAVQNARALRRLDGPALNPVLGSTAQLVAVFAVLFAVGIAIK